jgi:hypothetical protein
MDATLLAILLLLLFATVLGVIQGRRRDKCLRSFEGFHITLAEKGGDLSWGRAVVYTTGLEIHYAAPVVARGGYLERSFIFYKDQYEAIDALYRYPEGLPEAEQQRRLEIFEQTVNPGFWRRLGRRLQNWIAMVRDALMQAVSMVIGVARARKPGSAVLSTQETQLKALSSEIIGHAGNAFDPLLEQHLYTQVVLEVTREGRRRAWCGWLKDYTSQFIELVDAYANLSQPAFPEGAYAPGAVPCPGVSIRIEEGRLALANEGTHVLYVERAEAGPWRRPLTCVLPPGYTADLTLPVEVDRVALRVWLRAVDRVDLVVPRTHALVRHAADGSERHFPRAPTGGLAEVKAATAGVTDDTAAVSSASPPVVDATRG